MNIVDQIEQKYRQMKGYGVFFSIDSDAYDCDIGDRVEFGENETSMTNGYMHNYQDIMLDGTVIGYLVETISGKLFDPMTVSFKIPLEDSEVTGEIRESIHFVEDEWCCLQFATLQQMVDYIRIHGKLELQ